MGCHQDRECFWPVSSPRAIRDPTNSALRLSRLIRPRYVPPAAGTTIRPSRKLTVASKSCLLACTPSCATHRHCIVTTVNAGHLTASSGYIRHPIIAALIARQILPSTATTLASIRFSTLPHPYTHTTKYTASIDWTFALAKPTRPLLSHRLATLLQHMSPVHVAFATDTPRATLACAPP